MSNKAISVMRLATGIITTLAAITFAICTEINNELAMLVTGFILLLIGGMYLATTIMEIASEYFTKN